MKGIDQAPQSEGEKMSIEQLVSLLEMYQMPMEEWGSGRAKTVEDLLSEINSGETELIEEEGRLIRATEALAINVFSIADGKIWKLREDKQIFTDGRIRERRDETMDTSMGEKISIEELHLKALQRALQEELGVDENFEFDSREGETLIKERTSSSFPGLTSKLKLHYYDVLLPVEFYKKEGYVETQKNKCTYFTWEEVDGLPSTF
jgi:hypothetical protein